MALWSLPLMSRYQVSKNLMPTCWVYDNIGPISFGVGTSRCTDCLVPSYPSLPPTGQHWPLSHALNNICESRTSSFLQRMLAIIIIRIAVGSLLWLSSRIRSPWLLRHWLGVSTKNASRDAKLLQQQLSIICFTRSDGVKTAEETLHPPMSWILRVLTARNVSLRVLHGTELRYGNIFYIHIYNYWNNLTSGNSIWFQIFTFCTFFVILRFVNQHIALNCF